MSERNKREAFNDETSAPGKEVRLEKGRVGSPIRDPVSSLQQKVSPSVFVESSCTSSLSFVSDGCLREGDEEPDRYGSKRDWGEGAVLFMGMVVNAT